MKIQSLKTVYRADYLVGRSSWQKGKERETKEAALRDIERWRRDYEFEYDMRLVVFKTYAFAVETG